MLNILYAEDDQDCRELFSFVLQQRGHKIHEAVNGAQAVQIMREEAVDLVILDTRMPMMSGYDAAQIIAREQPQVPIAFFSAKGMHLEITQAFACSEHVVDYLVKPVLPNQLVIWVESTLQGCLNRGMADIREENMARELVAAG